MLCNVEDDKRVEDKETLLFYTNKNGFPVDEHTWKRMWDYAAKIQPTFKAEIEEIKNCTTLHEVPIPTPPVLLQQMSIPVCMQLIQNFINNLQYNHTGTQLFEIKKSRPLAGLMDKAKQMIKEALPIKCLEAVILAIYLTNGLSKLERFPIGFKSVFSGHCYYHVVLGVVCNGQFGALGISRRHDLMDKPLEFDNLSNLIDDYDMAYSKYTHQLKKVRLGGLLPHDMCSQEKIQWGVLTVNFTKTGHAERQRKIDIYSRDLRCYSNHAMISTHKKSAKRFPLQSGKDDKITKHTNYSLQQSKPSQTVVRELANPSGYHVKI